MYRLQWWYYWLAEQTKHANHASRFCCAEKCKQKAARRALKCVLYATGEKMNYAVVVTAEVVVYLLSQWAKTRWRL